MSGTTVTHQITLNKYLSILNHGYSSQMELDIYIFTMNIYIYIIYEMVDTTVVLQMLIYCLATQWNGFMTFTPIFSPPHTLDCRRALPPPPPPPTWLHHMLTSPQLSKSPGSWVLSISTHVYEEQITADSPLIPICKDFESPALLPHALVIKRLQNSCLCSFLDWERPLFYQECKVKAVENLKLPGHHMLTAMSILASQSSWSSCMHCLILTATMEKSTRSVTFTESEKR